MEYNYPEMNIHPNIYSLLRCDNQEDTAKYIKKVLDENNIVYYEDSYGNIYNLDLKNVPLLSAHMDTVMKEEDRKMVKYIFPDDTGLIVNGNIIGGDDKCGIFIALRILLSHLKANFIFSKDEEIGCMGIQALIEDVGIQNKIKNNCLYCLVLDRNGNSDIICFNNDYGTEEFEQALVQVSLNYGLEYKPATGLYSDADFISDLISTANLSVGYFNAHTKSETVELLSVENALFFAERIIEEVQERFEAPQRTYNNVRYFGYGYDPYKKPKISKLDKYFDEFDVYSTKEYEEKECDSCNIEVDDEVELISIYLENGIDLNVCPECAVKLYHQLRKSIGMYL